jgi:hypothetical protein
MNTEPEIVADDKPEVDPLSDPTKLKSSTYQLAVTFQCVKCGKGAGISDPQVIGAALRGLSIGMRCPACGEPQKLDAPARPEEPRVVLAQPNGSLNRHARRAMATQQRLIHGQR